MKNFLTNFIRTQITFLDGLKFWPDFMKVSNRTSHFVLGFWTALIFTVLFTAGCATGMEFKDSQQHPDGWDWIDWLATVTGGLIGQAVQMLFLFIFL